MTTISPTRVSMYDFLYQDTLPTLSLLADAAQLSLPQTRLAATASLQAIISALLAYQQRNQTQTISKKLFDRSAIKELRQYNALNFATMKTILYHRSDIANDIFGNSTTVTTASDYIASQINASTAQAQILLTALGVIVLRELAILADYSQLNEDELNQWFYLQPQFLSKARFTNIQYINMLDERIHADDESLIDINTDAKQSAKSELVDKESNDEEDFAKTNITDIRSKDNIAKVILPPFDPYWHELNQFVLADKDSVVGLQQATPNYLQAIGRAPENVQVGHHNDMLVFAPMSAIDLPHQRWLLQLAKIADIYLSRQRLRITSEPDKPPKRPLVNLGLIADYKNKASAPTSKDNTAIKHDKDKPLPLWKNPAILILIVVIGSLSALAAIKYQMQKSSGAVPATKTVLEQEHAKEVIEQNEAEEKITKENALKTDDE